MVGAIGLGCWSFGGAYGPTTEAESHETLARALDLGIDFLDTADVYGKGVSEQVIGTFIKGRARAFTIASKGGIRRDPQTNERTIDNSPEHLASALDSSLRNLGVERIDLYYIHRREQSRPIEEVMQTLVGFREAGKIDRIGFSEIAPASLRRAHAVHPVAAVQSEYSLWSRMPDLGMVQACRELGVAFVAFSPLARGMFASAAPDPSTFEQSDFRTGNPRFVEPNFSANLRYVERFKDYARELGTTPATLALAWTLHRGEHIIPIPGTRSARHLAEDAAAADLSLDAAELAEIERILPCGFAHGDRYTPQGAVTVERYC